MPAACWLIWFARCVPWFGCFMILMWFGTVKPVFCVWFELGFVTGPRCRRNNLQICLVIVFHLHPQWGFRSWAICRQLGTTVVLICLVGIIYLFILLVETFFLKLIQIFLDSGCSLRQLALGTNMQFLHHTPHLPITSSVVYKYAEHHSPEMKSPCSSSLAHHRRPNYITVLCFPEGTIFKHHACFSTSPKALLKSWSWQIEVHPPVHGWIKLNEDLVHKALPFWVFDLLLGETLQAAQTFALG